MQKIDNDVVFHDPQTVKVFPHRARQLIAILSPVFFPSGDGGRVEAYAPSLGEDPLVVVACECGGCVEAVCSPVCVEDVSFEGGPLELEGGKGGIVS